MPIQSISRKAEEGNSVGNTIASGILALANAKIEKMSEEKEKKEKIRKLKSMYSHLPESSLEYLSELEAKDRHAQIAGYNADLQRQHDEEGQRNGLQALQQAGSDQQQEPQGPQSQFIGGEQPQENTKEPFGLQDVTQEDKTALLEYLMGPQGQQMQQQDPQEFDRIKQFAETPVQQQQEQPETGMQALSQQAQPEMPPVRPARFGGGAVKKETASVVGELTDKQQTQINNSNSKPLKTITEYIDNAKRRKQIAEEMLDLAESGKLSGQFKGSYQASFMRGDEDSQFEALSTELANTKALELRGPVGQAKLEAAARTKPNLSQPNETRIKLINNEIENASKALAYEESIEELMQENNQQQPASFETKIRQRVKEKLDTPPASIRKDAADGSKGRDEYGQVWEIVKGVPKKVRG